MEEMRRRYSDAELTEFKNLIEEKIVRAKDDYELLRSTLTHTAGNGTEDTSPTFKVLEEGATTLSKEERTIGSSPVEVYPQFGDGACAHRE